MAQYPAVSVFAVDDTLISGKLSSHIIRQALLEAPSRAPRFAWDQAIWAGRRHILRQDTAPEGAWQAGLKLLSRMDPEARTFIVDYVVDRLVREALRPGAIDTLIQRRKAGDRIFFMSDCYDFCMARFAARLGGAEIVATRTFENPDGSVVVSVGDGPCAPDQKLQRLKQHFDGERKPPFVRAYAHHESDFAALVWADAGTAVNPSESALKQAQAMGLSIVDWSVGIHDAPLYRPAVPGAQSRGERQKSDQKSTNR